MALLDTSAAVLQRNTNDKPSTSPRELDPTKLHARVGIATGLVVVGDVSEEGSAQEQAVVGETPNLAARLQALAASADQTPPPPNLTTITGQLIAAVMGFQGSELPPTEAQLQACSREQTAYQTVMAKWAALKLKANGAPAPAAGRGGR